MANGSAFEHAVCLLRQFPNISVGTHLCLVGEKPLLQKEKIISIVDQEGILFDNYLIFLYKLYSARINHSQVYAELEAQIKRMIDMDIHPTHLDSHQYLHIFPPVSRIVIDLAKKYNIPWIRYPHCMQNNSKTYRDWLKKFFLSVFSRFSSNLLERYGISCADVSYGIIDSGKIDTHRLKTIIKSVKVGVNDITCHPGYDPENIKYNSWKYQWQGELKALIDNEIKTLIQKENLRLINYGF
jgi:predicted glycoside hydrolase/deacetylase ChbG (UPF0249 family)